MTGFRLRFRRGATKGRPHPLREVAACVQWLRVIQVQLLPPWCEQRSPAPAPRGCGLRPMAAGYPGPTPAAVVRPKVARTRSARLRLASNGCGLSRSNSCRRAASSKMATSWRSWAMSAAESSTVPRRCSARLPACSVVSDSLVWLSVSRMATCYHGVTD